MKTKQESLGVAFNRLWAASLASNIADGLFKTAVPLLAAVLTRDPVLIAALGAVVMLPWLLFAIPIGTIVDRVDRRRAMAVANLVRLTGGALLTASVIGGWVSIWLLYIVAFVIGAAEVLYDTTSQAIIPNLLKPELLERGNSKLEIGGMILGEMIGTPLSGLLFAVAVFVPFLGGNFGIAAATLMVLMIPHFAKPKETAVLEPKVSMFADMKFGIKYLYENKTLLKLVLFTTAVGFWFTSTGSTQVLFLLDVLHVPEAAFGFVFLAGAVGSIVGGILAPKMSKRFGRMNIMSLAILSSGVFIFLCGFTPNVFVWAILQLLGGIAMTFWNVLLMSTYHQIIPNELFGRIHGTRRTLVWGMMPLGAMVGGLIAKIDLRAPMLIGGAISALIALFGIPFIRRLDALVTLQSPTEQPTQE
ncbi:MAG: MFS transporter [Micrococcales bacterium]